MELLLLGFQQDIQIVVASHKTYWMPNDPMYIPVQVGAQGKEPIRDFFLDNQGENISSRNPRYCELTALYWAWKNLNAEYIGLSHYRRHFAGKEKRGVLSHEEASSLLLNYPVVMPSKRHYVIETVEAHYSHTFDGKHIQAVRDVLSEYDPAVLPGFERHMKKRSGHIWNMYIMRNDVLDEWCSWLFPLLFSIEKVIDFSSMSPFEQRVMGRLSERLIDPWLDYNRIRYIENPVVSLEGENTTKKIRAFLGAKFFNKKYKESF